MAEEKDDGIDGSFMAVRRNSNFTSLLICFLITTGASMQEITVFGIYLGASARPSVIWFWIGIVWVYYFMRFLQFRNLRSERETIEAARIADEWLYPSQRFKYFRTNENGDRSEEVTASNIAVHKPTDTTSFRFDDLRKSYVRLTHIQIIGENVVQVVEEIPEVEMEKWKKNSARNAGFFLPELLTRNTPEYLFYISFFVASLRIGYEILKWIAVPAIFSH